MRLRARSIISTLGIAMAALTACRPASAAAADSPSLAVEYTAGDSARAVARWNRPCDARGCADSYLVNWTAGTTAVPARKTDRQLDTLLWPRPVYGDSLRVQVAITALRRGIPAGTSAPVYTYIRNPDAPPPPVDSVRVDTLRTAALNDSYPTIAVRDTNGLREIRRSPGTVTQFCGLLRNRYTGQVHVSTDPSWDVDARNAHERRCDRARASYATERGG